MSRPTTSDDPARVASAPAVPRGWLAALLLATGGVFAGWFGPIQILLPAQSAALGDDGKEALLALVMGAGAIVAIVANPLWGLLSDRMSVRGPRRRPVVVAGTAVGVVGLLVLAFAPDPLWMVVGWVTVQVGLNGPFAALLAMIADRVPVERRGLVGSLFGVAQIAGVVLGTATAVALGEGSLGYLALAVAVPLLCVAIVVLPEPRAASDPDAASAPGSPEARPFRTVLAGLRPTSAFAWAWVIRLLLNLVNALVLVYLYFFLSDAVGVDDPGTWVLVLTLVNVVVTAIAAGIGGAWSDRIARRKVFVFAAVLVLAVGAMLFALIPVLPAVIVATVLIGAGWGLYVSVDVAIITQVLPSDRSTGSMLGVANVASALPQALAPLIAAPLVTGLGGYLALYLVTAVIGLLALFCLPRLRSVA